MAFGLDDAILMALMGGNFLGSLFGNKGGQDRQTFEGEKRGGLSLDPRDVLANLMTTIGRQGETINEYAAQPVALPGAYAQPLPIFGGGGLPFPIGATAMDPALSDPIHHLSVPGMAHRDPWANLGGLQHGGMPRQEPVEWNPGGTWGGPWTNPTKGRDLLARGGTPPKDMDQALAAFQLLGAA